MREELIVLISPTFDDELRGVRGSPRCVGGCAGVVARMGGGEALYQEGGGVLVVGADGHGGVGGGGGGGGGGLLPVPAPGEGDGEVALQDLAGDGGAHPFAQEGVGEQEGHDGRGSWNILKLGN